MAIDGNWELTVDSLMGQQHMTLSVHSVDGTLVGTLTNDVEKVTTEVFDGQVSGNDLTWKVKLTKIKLTLTFTASVDGDVMTGKAKAGMFGSFNVAGKRASV
jgi:hypothetical protein